MPAIKDEATFRKGAKFGKGIVVSDVSARAPNGKMKRKIGLKCACGKRYQADPSALKLGRTQSCGCLADENRRYGKHRKHGLSREPMFLTHKSMLARCYSETHASYHNYGGRGIKVSKRWRVGDGTMSGYECFVADMGERPAGMQIDRIDNDKGYSKSNCRWVSRKDNSNNRRGNFQITIGGVTRTMAQWAEHTGIRRSTIQGRLERGWTPEEAMVAPC